MKAFGIIMAVIIGFAFMSVALFTCGWVGNGVRTAHQEFDPSAMLKKYEWFKNQSQFILKAKADIANLKSESGIKAQYEEDNGRDHSKWSPIVVNSYQEELSQNKQQRLSMISNTNRLMADYNAQSSKFNWEAFRTKDDLPPQTFEALQ